MLRRKTRFQERYARFEEELREAIISGALKPGEFILPENTLSQKYGLSRVSVRKALAKFVEEGSIEKIPGKGNRVKPISLPSQRTILHLMWFSNSYEVTIVKEWIQRYESRNPAVRIELTVLPEVDYASSVLQLIDKGTPIDMFIFSDSHFREWIERGSTDILDCYRPAHLCPQKDSYQEVFDLFTYQAQLKVVPLFFSPLIMAYNRTMFEEAGLKPEDAAGSWDQFLKAAQRLTRLDQERDQVERYGYCFSASRNRWPLFVLQNGGSFLNDSKNRPVFDDPRNVEALQFASDLMYKHRVSPVYFHGDQSIVEHFFSKQRVAMIVTSYYYLNFFARTNLDWDIMPIPKGREKASFLIASGLGLNKRSPHLSLAQEFVDYITSTEGQRIAKQLGAVLPVLRSVAEDDDLNKPGLHPRNYSLFKEVLSYAKPLDSLGLTKSDWSFISRETDLLWGHLDRPQEVCRRIHDYLNEKMTQSLHR